MRTSIALLLVAVTVGGCASDELSTSDVSAPPSLTAAPPTNPATAPAPATATATAPAPAPGSATESASEPRCDGPAGEPSTFAYRSIDGVDPDLLSLDVTAPTGAALCPMIVWVHGGGWRIGDKQSAATTLKAEHFAAQGYLFASVNYRLVADDNDVRWPAFGRDVSAAVGWLHDNAADLGGDPERIILMGHSAGAQLVSIVATHPELLADVGLDRSDLTCVASLDSTAYDLTSPAQNEGAVVASAFGDDVDARLDASPLVQVAAHGADDVAEFLIVTRGPEDRVSSSNDFGQALRDAGTTARVVDVSPYTHREVNVMIGQPGDSVLTPVLDDFVASCR